MSNVSLNLKAKADRLIAEGRVKRIQGLRYEVQGDTDTYTVWLSYPQEASGRCSCPRNQNTEQVCSHLFAASVLAMAEPAADAHLEAAYEDRFDPFEGLSW